MAAIGGAGMCRAYGAGACGGPDHPGLPAWAKFCRASGAGGTNRRQDGGATRKTAVSRRKKKRAGS